MMRKSKQDWINEVNKVCHDASKTIQPFKDAWVKVTEVMEKIAKCQKKVSECKRELVLFNHGLETAYKILEEVEKKGGEHDYRSKEHSTFERELDEARKYLEKEKQAVANGNAEIQNAQKELQIAQADLVKAKTNMEACYQKVCKSRGELNLWISTLRYGVSNNSPAAFNSLEVKSDRNSQRVTHVGELKTKQYRFFEEMIEHLKTTKNELCRQEGRIRVDIVQKDKLERQLTPPLRDAASKVKSEGFLDKIYSPFEKTLKQHSDKQRNKTLGLKKPFIRLNYPEL